MRGTLCQTQLVRMRDNVSSAHRTPGYSQSGRMALLSLPPARQPSLAPLVRRCSTAVSVVAMVLGIGVVPKRRKVATLMALSV